MPTLTTRTTQINRADLDRDELEFVLREYVHAPADAEVRYDAEGATIMWETPVRQEDKHVANAA